MPDATHAILLHAHLPFVRHPEHDDFLEEDWLYEAVFESYLPLIRILRSWKQDGIPAKISTTVTPPLCEMLGDPLLRSRCERYLERGAELCRREEQDGPAERRTLITQYRERFESALRFYRDDLSRDVVGAFAELQEEGVLEIVASAATHGFLPLMQQFPGAVRAQVFLGRDFYRKWFGRDPAGFWLPECAYSPGIDEILSRAEIRWFVSDAHGVLFGAPRPRFAIFAPYFTPSGPACFGRDRESSRQVWSSREGYPGDPAYRDFYRDLGQEIPIEVLEGVYGNGTPRRFTGVKLHRITGKPDHEKEWYRPEWAEAALEAHASDFLRGRLAQFEDLAAKLPVPPILVSPFDAELFGHWWFEGPRFLDLYVRKAACDQKLFQLGTPTDFLQKHPTQQILSPSASSWGNNGYWEVWLNQTNAWIYPHLHTAAKILCGAATRHAADASEWQSRCLSQMARELLLAQSSDWAFLMKTGTAIDYATRRTKQHLSQFHQIHQLFETSHPEENSISALQEIEDRDTIFPEIQWNYYAA